MDGQNYGQTDGQTGGRTDGWMDGRIVHPKVWEGDGKGEGVLPLLKKHVRSLTGDWAYHAVEKYYKDRAIDRVAMMVLMEKIKVMYPNQMESVNQNVVQELLDVGSDIFGAHQDSLQEEVEYVIDRSYYR
jgi:hypothetical protein